MVEAKMTAFQELAATYRARFEECKSLLENETVKALPFLQEDLETLVNLTELAGTILQEDIEIAVDDDNSLSIVSKWNKSRFSPMALVHYLDGIKENIKKVEGYIATAKAEGVEIQTGDIIENNLKSADDMFISFTFNIGAFRNEDLHHAYRCLSDDDFVTKTPFEPKSVDPMNIINERADLPDGFDLFVLYSTENRKDPNKRFAISNSSKCPDGSLAYTRILSKNRGEEKFELPGKPSKPVYVENSKTVNSLKIELIPSNAGEGNVTGYKILIFEVGSLIKTIDEPKINPGSSEFLVEDLQQGMEYSFKVQSVSPAGCSPKSAMSEKIMIDVGVVYKASRGIRLSSGS